MKCRLSQDLTKCHRCARKSLDCVFQQHRRGRKLGTKLNTQCSSKSDRPALVESTAEPRAQNQDDFGLAAGRQPDEPESVARDFWADNDGFQPPSLLNRHAAKGNFSLQNVLSTNAEPMSVTAGISSSARTEDPIAMGLLNHAIATSLFERFMENLNPFISQFDPILHTFGYVRETSPFLFSAVLAAAAKALNPSLFTPLHDHAERLFARAFRRGDKSPEVVQAILVLTYWKEPEDTRAFVNVGLAIRIAMEIGWHKLVVNGQTSGSNGLGARRARNIQRTWLLLFVYDRSISMQTGRPWMIERDQFIEAVGEWYSSSLAAPHDGLLCAFVTLRLLTADIPALVHPKSNSLHAHVHNPRPLLKIMEDHIDRWQGQWTKTLERERCHRFLIAFYGAHTLLLLFSLPLQSSLSPKSTLIDMEALWISYNAAIRMLHLVSEESGSFCLYFAQDSIHVMIAYAAVFLIKLLLSVPRAIRREIETTTLQTLRTTALIFSQQAAPANCGCALQSMFLANVVALVEKVCQRRIASNTFEHTSRPCVGQQSEQREAEKSSNQVTGVHDRCIDMVQDQNTQSSHDQGIEVETINSLSITPQSQDFKFFDDEMWSSMFANAGFSIDDGIFLPDVDG
ncbi:Nn.00g060170.m01.CDS01 [Neocucurbitaria sp. VM-36]